MEEEKKTKVRWTEIEFMQKLCREGKEKCIAAKIFGFFRCAIRKDSPK